MLLKISTTERPATDLGFLLHKHPDRFQSFELSFGSAHVYYPEASEDRCTACLLLDVDPVEMARGRSRKDSSTLSQYVNDRPYVASSFMSTAISRVFGSALAGRCKNHPELVDQRRSLDVNLHVLPVKGGEAYLRSLFEPLGYEVECETHVLDEQFASWGSSPYLSVRLQGTITLAELLNHLYVLIPVFDNQKHYFIGQDELEKLLAKGDGWLSDHPEKRSITRRYLRFRGNLVRQALSRLIDEDDDAAEGNVDQTEEAFEKPLSLNEQRMGAVMAALRSSGAKSVLDLGCGEGKLLRELCKDKQFHKIVGMDVSIRVLEYAAKRLKIDTFPQSDADRVRLIQGSLMYRDSRLSGMEAAAVVEVIEHLDPPRLSAFERVLFEHARPDTVVLTTPNSEYNVLWESLPAGKFRHADHRFEWTRDAFQSWAGRVGQRYGYSIRFVPVGPEDDRVGAPTQMGIFQRHRGAAE